MNKYLYNLNLKNKKIQKTNYKIINNNENRNHNLYILKLNLYFDLSFIIFNFKLCSKIFNILNSFLRN